MVLGGGGGIRSSGMRREVVMGFHGRILRRSINGYVCRRGSLGLGL